MRPQRWLVLATHVPAGGHLGGVVRYTTQLLSALVRRGDRQVSVLASSEGAQTLACIVGRERVHVVPAMPTVALSIAERWRPVDPGQFDVVLGVKHLVPRRCRALRVLTVHDMVLLDRPSDFPLPKRVLLPPFYRASIRDADLLLSVSQASRTRLAAHDPVAAARCAVVPLATAPDLLAAVPRAVPRLVGRRFALIIGDSSPRKNLAAVVDAWPGVLQQVPDAVLAIAGPPAWGRSESGAAYSALVASGALAPLGRIDDAELRWCYENAAVVLCPSVAEGFGLPAAEALDFGVEVVVSDDAALQEVAAGRARAVVPAGDTMGWATVTTQVLLGPRGQTPRPPRRSWDDVAEETVTAVEAALRTRQRAHS